jgi:hypothetical protein
MDKLYENVGREILVYTTPIFPSFETALRIDPPGTGTFVYFRNFHYILTAAHVWDYVRRAPEMGLGLKEGVDQRYLVPTAAIECFGPPWPARWGEWGPDIALLRLPVEIAAEIKIHRAFYDLEKDRSAPNAGIESEWKTAPTPEVLARIAQRKSGQTAQLAGRVLMGTPKEFGSFREAHASVKLNAMFLGLQNAQEYSVGDFDFVDLDTGAPSDFIPSSFEGVSGGGLWRYITTISDDGDKTTKFLEGVAFYQLTGEGGRRIRCHGKQSLRALTSQFMKRI